jgi:hypothetical protein
MDRFRFYPPFLDLIINMKLKQQDQDVTQTNMQLTDSDKEKGNFKNFNISKQTIKKLKGKNSISNLIRI